MQQSTLSAVTHHEFPIMIDSREASKLWTTWQQQHWCFQDTQKVARLQYLPGDKCASKQSMASWSLCCQWQAIATQQSSVRMGSLQLILLQKTDHPSKQDAIVNDLTHTEFLWPMLPLQLLANWCRLLHWHHCHYCVRCRRCRNHHCRLNFVGMQRSIKQIIE
jgi:hypothetical protein